MKTPNIQENEREHETDMPHCWCNHKKEVIPNGNMVIIHNYKNMQNQNREMGVQERIIKYPKIEEILHKAMVHAYKVGVHCTETGIKEEEAVMDYTFATEAENAVDSLLKQDRERLAQQISELSEHFGGGITSIEEITDVLEFLVSKKVFEKRLE